MMGPSTQMEREEESLCEDYNNGSITLSEYNRAVNDLHREYRAQAEEAAQEAYERELDRW
jgi:hypothetical protein